MLSSLRLKIEKLLCTRAYLFLVVMALQTCLLDETHHSHKPSWNLFFQGVGQFNGKLGKLLQSPKFHERKIKGFTRIKCPEFPILDDSVVRELSQDNYLLYSFCVAATTGISLNSLYNLNIWECHDSGKHKKNTFIRTAINLKFS